jgi:DnaJ-class molecular chaperone
MKCKDCNGLGLSDCSQCKGAGFDYGLHKCEACSGGGRIACASCSGHGKISFLRRFKKT